jgi:hypothetical protein
MKRTWPASSIRTVIGTSAARQGQAHHHPPDPKSWCQCVLVLMGRDVRAPRSALASRRYGNVGRHESKARHDATCSARSSVACASRAEATRLCLRDGREHWWISEVWKLQGPSRSRPASFEQHTASRLSRPTATISTARRLSGLIVSRSVDSNSRRSCCRVLASEGGDCG